ncbi:MAG: hypothetical protein V4736_06225 [Bdellovibrionota bacterium]
MNKMITFAVTSLLTSLAFAWPAVGDSSTFVAVSSVSGATSTMEVKITATAIDAAADTLTLEMVTLAADGQTQTETQTAPLSSFQQLAQALPMLLGNCAAVGGVVEVLKTDAGTFDTCKMTDDSAEQTGFIWFANVPFGFVKQTHTVIATGATEELVLKSYVNGL